jgi:membrane protease YdiL (CAAX protease family)
MPDSAPESLVNPGRPDAVDTRDRMTAVIEILLCSSIPTQLAIGALLRLLGIRSTDPAGHLSFTFVLTLSLIDTAVLIVMMVLLMRAHGESARWVWFGAAEGRSAGSPAEARRAGLPAEALRAKAGRDALIGLATVPLVFVGVGILLNTIRLFVPSLHNVQTNPLEQFAATPGQAALFSLVAILAGGVREELQRAFMLRRFEQYLGGITVGVWVISIAFGLGHLMQGWDAVITTGTLGAFWAWMYVRRRSSVGPIVSHAGFNSLEILRIAVIGA